MEIKNLVSAMLMVALLTTTGIGSTDYTPLENMIENGLEDELVDVYTPSVSISEQEVRIEYKSRAHSEDDITEGISGIIGAYMYIVQTCPEVGDMVLIIKNPNDGSKVAKLTCEKDWVQYLDTENEDDIADVIVKVVETATFY